MLPNGIDDEFLFACSVSCIPIFSEKEAILYWRGLLYNENLNLQIIKGVADLYGINSCNQRTSIFIVDNDIRKENMGTSAVHAFKSKKSGEYYFYHDSIEGHKKEELKTFYKLFLE